MRQIIYQLIFIYGFFLFGACTPSDQNKFSIRVDLEGANDGAYVQLRKLHVELANRWGDTVRVDTTRVKNGKFEFNEVSIDHPQLYSIEIFEEDDGEWSSGCIPVFLEHSDLTVKANLDSLPDTGIYSDIPKGYPLDQVEISGGGPLHQEYMSFINESKQLNEELKRLFIGKYGPLLEEKEKRKGKASEGIAIATRIEEIEEARKHLRLDYIKKNPANMLGLYLAGGGKMSEYSVSELDEVLEIVGAVIDTPLGKEVKKKIEEFKATAPGATYIDLPLNDANGNPMNLSDYLGKGKYVLLEFWASWCGPCRASIPHFKGAYDMYNPEGFEIVSVSMDEKKEHWLKALKEEEMPWPQLSDLQAFEGDLAKTYRVSSIPACLLIDPDGKIVTRNMRGFFMDKRLIAIYGNKFGDNF